MQLTRVDPARLDPATAAEAARVSAEQLAVDAPGTFPPSPEGLRLAAKHGFDDSPAEAFWVVRDDDGTMLGHAQLEVSHWDNPKQAMVFCQVAPSAHDRGVGTALLEAQVALARELDRSILLTFTGADSHSSGFLAANSFTVGQHTAQRRLDPQRLDPVRLRALADEAAAHADDYELVRLDGPTPPELVGSLTAVFEAINDAPLDGVDQEPDLFPAERIRRYDAAMVARHQHVYRILARHRRTGDLAGHTILCVDETRPGYAVQEDTSVLGSHRGHRLGMWMKASMLLWMREAHPELTAIDTWNATSNTHMIAVNDALGCWVSRRGVAMQRLL